MPFDRFFIFGSSSEIEDPLLLEFMEAIGDQGYLDFETLQQKEFMKFWPNIVINRLEDGDFKYIFHGTNVVKNVGQDRTGLKILELKNHTQKKMLLQNLQEIIDTKQTVFAIGHARVEGREHVKWQQVKMPLRRKGEINEVVSFFSFQSK